MAIGNIQFGQLSNPYQTAGKYSVESGYHQAYQAPTTTPVIAPSYKTLGADEYAFMENYNNGKVAINPTTANPFAPAKKVDGSKGALWGDGFEVPPNNGTGELSPIYSTGREDEIIGLDFKC